MGRVEPWNSLIKSSFPSSADIADRSASSRRRATSSESPNLRRRDALRLLAALAISCRSLIRSFITIITGESKAEPGIDMFRSSP